MRAFNRLLKETGVDLSPEPDVWATLNKVEEDSVLSRIWSDKLLLSLLKKYAEIANKNMVSKAVMNEQFWKSRGEFSFILKLLLKAKRAHARTNENRKGDNQG